MHDPTEPADPVSGDPLLYDVSGVPDTIKLLDGRLEFAGLTLPRRPGHGRRGILLVDRPAALVYLLDADDHAGTFRYRETRPLAGDPGDLDPPRDGSDHLVRAAVEDEYDVIAAPWAGTPDEQSAYLAAHTARAD
jgi:hypothetical protein